MTIWERVEHILGVPQIPPELNKPWNDLTQDEKYQLDDLVNAQFEQAQSISADALVSRAESIVSPLLYPATAMYGPEVLEGFAKASGMAHFAAKGLDAVDSMLQSGADALLRQFTGKGKSVQTEDHLDGNYQHLRATLFPQDTEHDSNMDLAEQATAPIEPHQTVYGGEGLIHPPLYTLPHQDMDSFQDSHIPANQTHTDQRHNLDYVGHVRNVHDQPMTYQPIGIGNRQPQIDVHATGMGNSGFGSEQMSEHNADTHSTILPASLY
jgi:hypothetical protein